MTGRDGVMLGLLGFVLRKKEAESSCLSCSIDVPLNNKFFSLLDSLGPSSMFFGLQRDQRSAVMSRFVVLLL
jgi:hypothetical protein